MPTHYRRPRRARTPRAVFRWPTLKQYVASAGAASLAFGLIIGVPKVIPVIWPMFPAWINYVHTYTDTELEPIKGRITKAELAAERINITLLKGQLIQAEKDQLAAPTVTTRDHVQYLKEEIAAAEARVTAARLSVGKAAGTP